MNKGVLEVAHIISYHFISFHIISYQIISYHIISYHFISYHIISYHIISFHIISYHIISFHIISYHFISFHIISYHIISYHIISYHIIIFPPKKWNTIISVDPWGPWLSEYIWRAPTGGAQSGAAGPQRGVPTCHIFSAFLGVSMGIPQTLVI